MLTPEQVFNLLLVSLVSQAMWIGAALHVFNRLVGHRVWRRVKKAKKQTQQPAAFRAR